MSKQLPSTETELDQFSESGAQVGKWRLARRGTFSSDIEANRNHEDGKQRDYLNHADAEAYPQTETLVTEAQARLKALITGGAGNCPQDGSTILDNCFNFYRRFLEQRFREVNKSHIVPCLKGSVNGRLIPVLNLLVMYKLLINMAELALAKDNLTLQDMIDKQDQFDSKFLPTSALLTQLIFMAFGWISMLYDPDTQPSVNKLQLLRATRVRSPSQTSTLKTEFLHTFEQGFQQLRQPLDNLFCGFGTILPPFESPLTRCPSPTSPSSMKPTGHEGSSEYLILSFLSYHTLIKVAKIKIEWVESLNLHLEFDEGTRVLKLFRYPSFCRLMYPEAGSQTFLHRIFSSRPIDFEPHVLFQEILLSYRLLFGQDRRSWNAFNADFRNIAGITKDGDQAHDPLLVRLCGRKWTHERAFYRDIGAPEAPNHYSATRDFPFLGARLARLQHFSEVQNPHDWKVLWYDQRDIMRFYTFWAVIIFGGGTLIISLFQMIIQAVFSYLQLAAANYQNVLQAQQLALPG